MAPPKYISPLSPLSRQEEDPRLGNYSVSALQGGENFLPKFTLEDKETWCFYFSVIMEQQHTPIFFPLSGQQDCSNHLPQTKTCSHLIFSLSLNFWICIYKMSLNEPYWFPPGSCHGCIFVCLSMWLQEKNAGTSSETHHSRLSQILLNVSSVKSEEFGEIIWIFGFLDHWKRKKFLEQIYMHGCTSKER